MLTRTYLSLMAISFLLILAILIGCTNKPSTRQSKFDLQKWFDSRWPNTLSIVEYHKTKEEGDDKRYTIYYQAKVKFGKDTTGCERTCCGEMCFDKLINGFRWLLKTSKDPNVIRTGDMFEMSGRDIFNKTEKVWLSETF